MNIETIGAECIDLVPETYLAHAGNNTYFFDTDIFWKYMKMKNIYDVRNCYFIKKYNTSQSNL